MRVTSKIKAFWMQGKYWMLSGHLGGYSPAPGSKADNLCIPID